MTASKAERLFDATANYPSHSDVVVAVRSEELDVIGLNVKDSVTMKRLPIDASGYLADTSHARFAVLKLRMDS